jgi:hypothetical protein
MLIKYALKNCLDKNYSSFVILTVFEILKEGEIQSSLVVFRTQNIKRRRKNLKIKKKSFAKQRSTNQD